MEAFSQITSLAVPLNRANVDTDAIIPKQFLKSIQRTGFGPYLFDEWRYLDRGEPGMDCTDRPINPDFILNKPVYRSAKILLARENFGCGSSREHAPWALENYGFRVIVAPSFADIFYNNCFKNGLLPVVLSPEQVDELFAICNEETTLTVSLENQTIVADSGPLFQFEIDASRKHRLLNGLDDIGLTLQLREEINSYETRRKATAPWLFETSN